MEQKVSVSVGVARGDSEDGNRHATARIVTGRAGSCIIKLIERFNTGCATRPAQAWPPEGAMITSTVGRAVTHLHVVHDCALSSADIVV